MTPRSNGTGVADRRASRTGAAETVPSAVTGRTARSAGAAVCQGFAMATLTISAIPAPNAIARRKPGPLLGIAMALYAGSASAAPSLPGEGNHTTVRGNRRLSRAQTPELGARYLVPRLVARPDQRPRFDVPEPEPERFRLHLAELVRVVIPLDREVLRRWAQVLADRQDVAVDVAKGAERRRQLGPRLAEPDHQRALRVNGVRRLGRVDLGSLQHPQRPIPPGPLPDGLLQALDRLEVVVEDVRRGGHDRSQRRLLRVEVRDQDLDAHPG